jgi:hypothetical protein
MSQEPFDPAVRGKTPAGPAPAPEENGEGPAPPGASTFWRHKALEELAAEQGVGPVNDPQELAGDFWPEEDTEEFLAWLRRLRREGREGL